MKSMSDEWMSVAKRQWWSPSPQQQHLMVEVDLARGRCSHWSSFLVRHIFAMIMRAIYAHIYFIARDTIYYFVERNTRRTIKFKRLWLCFCCCCRLFIIVGVCDIVSLLLFLFCFRRRRLRERLVLLHVFRWLSAFCVVQCVSVCDKRSHFAMKLLARPFKCAVDVFIVEMKYTIWMGVLWPSNHHFHDFHSPCSLNNCTYKLRAKFTRTSLVEWIIMLSGERKKAKRVM